MRYLKTIFYAVLTIISKKIDTFIEDWKYDRELSKCFRLANKRIDEAQKLSVSKGYVYYVLPDRKGDFFCFNSKEREWMVKNKIISKQIDGYYCQKNSIFIARPNGQNTKRELKPTREWLGKK